MARDVLVRTATEYLSEIGRRGGEAKVPKGFAQMSEEKRQKAMAKSLKTRRRNAKAKAAAAAAGGRTK